LGDKPADVNFSTEKAGDDLGIGSLVIFILLKIIYIITRMIA